MDHDSHFQAGVDAERTRMSSFTFGKPASPLGAPPPPRHSRSHSRNGSVSVSLSLPTPVSATSPLVDSPPGSPTRNSLGGSKRNSHHRRLSSVSTRRESADLMGIALPSIPISSSEDNINLGDKDSIRRRALWALEGKDAGNTFSVEIPELDAPEVPQRGSFEFPSKPSFPPGTGFMGSKRDSLRVMVSTPSSEVLGTLVEEEEEEEEETKEIMSPVQESPASATISTPSSPPTRPRPAILNLRPLSLSLVANSSVEPITPSPTPSPRPGLRSLTLPASQSPGANKRQSVIISPSPSPSPNAFGRRPPLNLVTENTQPPPSRRSSISYVSNSDGQTVSVFGLPTPEMTPISTGLDRRRPTSASSSGSMDLGQLGMQRGRPLSMSEQHFLFQAHETLVQRITDLEKALARNSSSRSRPVSFASDVSSAVSSEPSDEMLQLIADLKAERDDLKRDVDGWRTRVVDLQYQIDIHAKRLEAERRDAWVARQRVGLLEVEKCSLEKTVSEKTAAMGEVLARYDIADKSLKSSQQDVARLNAEVQRLRSVDEECARLREELVEERKARTNLERELDIAGLLDTPRPFTAAAQPIPASIARKSRGLGFRSIDSESSFTDVDSVDYGSDLKVVDEVDEDDTTDDEDDELARYEDQEEDDDEYDFPTTSSYNSVIDYARSATPRLSTDSGDSVSAPSTNRSPSPSPLPSPSEPTHARRASLVKAWTFPANAPVVPTVERPIEDVDRFFGCLEDVDNSPPIDSKLHSIESNKRLFSQALEEFDDDLPPFVIPADVGEIVMSPEMERPLDVVVEEDEEDDDDENDKYDHDEEFVGEEDEGGIKFTFNVPASYLADSDADTSTPALSVTSTPESTGKSTQVFEPIDEDEGDDSFTFPQLKSQRNTPSPSGIPRLRSSSPSMIPVSTASSPMSSPKSFSLPLRINTSPMSFSTPPRRVSTAPTFIPVPRATSSPVPLKAPCFVPQPTRASFAPRPSGIPVMSPPAPSRLPYSTHLPSMFVSDSPVRSPVYSRSGF
ncbi:uncharacterized protein BXZ73DRAFT_40176 [Epithele typhae]|uniref:uncharacterized protein n=1 Tax=Epithele typhae TaxID=378194 RepID=UPI0020072F58|nr:uncharacterized protein BXZ73DRAFT_40176 [Epithele typhae]KAH9943014.1 hypothetical protein BXZ73DRAFT_40176 [Epithele typhae]